MTWKEKIDSLSKVQKFKNLNTERKHLYYSTPQWRNLSRIYRMEHPLCELCTLEGRVEPVSDVHHVLRWDEQTTPELKTMLLYDTDNIIGVCVNCHQNIHKRPRELSDNQKQLLMSKKEKLMEKYLKNGIIIKITDDNTII